jgi:uncharacterized membrane protein YeaQ/YmgE (transglycosylase-associated protein family)
MLNNLDTQTLLVVGLAVAVAAFFVGSAMNAVLENTGFGTVGNMMILIAGAFLGFYLGDNFTSFTRDTAFIAISGISGGFFFLAALATLKVTLSKFGF